MHIIPDFRRHAPIYLYTKMVLRTWKSYVESMQLLINYIMQQVPSSYRALIYHVRCLQQRLMRGLCSSL